MRLNREVLERNSEEDLAQKVHTLSDAGAGVIHLRTSELNRALAALRLAITVDDARYQEWDIIHGWRAFDIQNRMNPDVPGNGKIVFNGELLAPDKARQEEASASAGSAAPMQYFVYVNPQYWFENNPPFAHMIEHYTRELPSTNVRVILVTPDMPLPDHLSDSVVTVTLDPPGHVELRKYLDGIFEDLSDEITLTEEEKDSICHGGAGMTQGAFEMYASVAIVEANNSRDDDDSALEITAEDVAAGVADGKTAVVSRSDLLELYPGESMDDVGGLDLIKEWVDKRKVCFTEEAAEFGVESPKGIVFVGPPGTGKSLIAKAVANTLGVPLIRFDFGKVFNSLVGSSEERIRKALRDVNHMAPCVLFVDEIDKGLGGIGGGGDSGTSSRVLGTFLTWLNDTTAPVFTMVTANNINGLPPELMRKGRFDEIFASGLPDDIDRRTILAIHLRKRGWDIDDFDDSRIEEIVDTTNSYSGAEIEASVREGLVDAFHQGCTREEPGDLMGFILAAAKMTIPLAKSYKDQIAAMTVWAKGHARAASRTRKSEKRTKAAEGARRRVRTRVSTKSPAKSPARRRKSGPTGVVH